MYVRRERRKYEGFELRGFIFCEIVKKIHRSKVEMEIFREKRCEIAVFLYFASCNWAYIHV